jgi:hypothetical protein
MNDSIYVPYDYRANVEHDVILWSGDELKPGMIVLVEDRMVRANPSRLGDNVYEDSRINESARWCEVKRVEIREGIVKFLAEYPDGTQAVRTYSVRYSWIAKRDSIPSTDE